MKLRDLFRRISERVLRRSHSTGGNGAAPYQPGQPASFPIPEDYAPFGVNWGENPVYVHSQEAYYRNLPELLKKHEGKWVAYHGDECVGIGRTKTGLWELCMRRGLRPGEFYVDYIFTGALHDHDEPPLDAIDPGEPLPGEYK